jgi:WD40 repeat protein
VQLWDIAEPRRPQRLSEPLTGFTGFISNVTFSPDGRTVFAGSTDRTVRAWDITDPLHAAPIGTPLHSLGNVAQVAFSPDGKTLASGGDDGRVQLWGITDRAHPAAIGDSLIPPGAASQTRVAFDPQGRLYAASRDGTIRIWNLDTGADNAAKRICASTRNVLTEQRWNQILPDLPYNPPCQPATSATAK